MLRFDQRSKLEELIDKELGQRINWVLLAYDEQVIDDFNNRMADGEGLPLAAIPLEFILAVELRIYKG